MAPLKTSRDFNVSPVLVQLQYTVWNRVRSPVLAATAWATFLYFYDIVIGIPPLSGVGAFTAFSSMVVGLMVNFRASSSYDRWYEGRRLWCSLQSTSRNLLRTLVFALPPPEGESSADQERAVKEIASLVCAFAHATKHHLRGEHGLHSASFRALLPAEFIASMEGTPASNHGAPPQIVLQAHALPSGAPTNLPLAILRALHGYLNAYHATPAASSGSPSSKTPALDGPTYAFALNALSSFTDQLTNLERIKDTPIPLVLYSHLQILLFTQLAAFPLQLVRSLGWGVIPTTAAAAFTFYGVDRAGEELSDPFGKDKNDLPIDAFCAAIEREYIEMTGQGKQSGSGVMNYRPQPLAEKKAL